MDIKGIAIMVFVFLVLLYVVINAFSKSNKLSEMTDATILQTIKATDLKNTNSGNNYTYSMWIYITDWNHRFGEEKTILDRASCPKVVLDKKDNSLKVYIKCMTATSAISDIDGYIPLNCADQAENVKACNACDAGFACACDNCNRADFVRNGNKLSAFCPVSTSTTPVTDAAIAAAQTAVNNAQTAYDSANAGEAKEKARIDLYTEKNKLALLKVEQSPTAFAASIVDDSLLHTCVVSNISIQKWVNVIVSLYNLTLDVYIDGKLVRTCILPGVPKNNNTASILITPDGGFSGWTTTFKFFPYASNPQEAFNLYKDGFGGSIVGNAISKYRLRVSMTKDNKVQTSFEV